MRLTLYVGKIDIVALMGTEKSADIPASRQQRKLTAQKLKCLTEILHAVDVDLVDHGGFARICLRHEQRLFSSASRFQRNRQYTFDRSNAAVERELAHETKLFERASVQFFADRNHAERDRQIETRSFFFDVGRREIHRRASARPAIAAVCDCGSHAIA